MLNCQLSLFFCLLLIYSINAQPIPGCADIDNLEETFNFDHSKLEDLLLCFCQSKSDTKIAINCLYGSSLDDLSKAIALVKKANRTVDQVFMNHVEFNETGLDAGVFHRMGVPLSDITIGMCAQSEPLKIHPNAFDGLEKSLRNVSIFECSLTEFPIALSKLTSLERLSLANNKILTVNREMLSTHKNLISLNLAGNFLSNIDEGALSQLKILQTLIIGEHNFINESFMNEFGQMNDLKILDLSKADGVDNINNSTFSKLNKLEQLILTGCSLQNITKHTFNGLTGLKQLDLRVNLIERIDNDSFIDLKKLQRLSLAGNYLQTLNASIFNGLEELDELDLGWNELDKLGPDTFKDLKRLRLLDLRHNQKLEKIDDKAFQGLDNLQKLNMSETALKRLGKKLLEPLPKLEALDLNSSNLTEIASDALKEQMATLKALYLSNTHLRQLNGSILTSLNNLEQLDLSKNLWLCDDKFAPVIDAIIAKYDSATQEHEEFLLHNANETQCDRPYSLRGQVITEIEQPSSKLTKYNIKTDTTTSLPSTTTTTQSSPTTQPFTFPAVTIGQQSSQVKSHVPEPEEDRPKYNINEVVSTGQKGSLMSGGNMTLIVAVGAMTLISVIVIAAVMVYLKRRRPMDPATDTELKDSPIKKLNEHSNVEMRSGKVEQGR